MLELCGSTSELEVFDSQTLAQVIDFKWKAYARNFMYMGCFFHFFYIFTISVNVVEVFERVQTKNNALYQLLLGCGIVYPLLYDSAQLYYGGFKNYFSTFWNYTDFLFIWSGVASIVMQNIFDPFSVICKFLMIVTIFCAIFKTFFFLRIFSNLSYIVTMITNVIFDLRIFGLFYAILIYLFSLMFGVLGIGNKLQPGVFKTFIDEEWEEGDDYPMQEYQFIGLPMGNIMNTLRMSLGDFDFDASLLLLPTENYMFWVIWAVVVIVTCIIFLNFIIAEASASYEDVKSRLDAMIVKERTLLVQESEEMLLKR